MKRILFSLVVIGIVGGLAFGLSQAFFSDTETSSGNIFQAGAIDLKIDNTSYFNGELNQETTWELDDLDGHLFFNFTDIKPSDWGEDTVSIHVDTNDAWACFEIDITKNDDNNCTSPELVDDPDCDQGDDFDGELAQNVEFLFWVDDGDNVLEDDETGGILASGLASEVLDDFQGALADADENNVGGSPGDPLVGEQTYYIGKAWCFGDLTLDPVAQGANSPTEDPGIDCDGSSLNNATQTDILMGDISFSAVQHRNNPGFLCNPEATPEPTPAACSEETVWAASVASSNQGLRKNGTAVNADRSNTSNVLGPPEGLVSPPEWYTLGFGGSITIAFANPVGDGVGDDISIHEVTGGRATYPEETATVEVSADNSSWFEIGTASSEPGGGGDGVTFFDISSNGSAPSLVQYVRVTDTTDSSIHNDTADGFDLDAVDGVYGACGE